MNSDNETDANDSNNEESCDDEETDVVNSLDLNALEAYETDAKNPFIISCEKPKSDPKAKPYRQYYLFESFGIFLHFRKEYSNCHEILANHVNNGKDPSGRLVFDIDSKEKPKVNVKSELEKLLMYMFTKYMIGIDLSKIDFVWASSQRKTKYSKHLTVKNIYFDDWVNLCKLFCEFLKIELEEKKIMSFDMFDIQIYKKRGSLRMVGSSKIDGISLVLDNPSYKLEDSLIRIYNKKTRKLEQKVTIDNFRFSQIQKYRLYNYLNIDSSDHFNIVTKRIYKNNCNDKKTLRNGEFNDIFELVFKEIDKIQPDTFVRSGRESYNPDKKSLSMDLDRISKNYCIYTDKRRSDGQYIIHDSHGIYVFIYPPYDDSKPGNYIVSIGCYKLTCTQNKEKKTFKIGRIIDGVYMSEFAATNIKSNSQLVS